MRMKKILIVILTVTIILSSFTITVFADVFGKKVTIDMRWSDVFHCIAPVDTTYYYYYIISGDSGDFNWIGNDYVLVWSKEKLIVENNSLQLSEPIYYVSAAKLETLVNGLTTDRTSLTVYQTTSFTWLNSTNFKVHYSNQQYSIDGKSYPAYWMTAIEASHTELLTTYLATVFEGLKNAKIKVFGTELSAYVMIAGPFLISFTVSVLQKIIGVGDAAAVHSVSAGRNIKRKYKEKKEERNRQGK